jgi:hypothetical protein
VYLKAYQDAGEARKEIGRFIGFYNRDRPHQTLGYQTPAHEYYADTIAVVKERVIPSEQLNHSGYTSGRIAGSHLSLE